MRLCRSVDLAVVLPAVLLASGASCAGDASHAAERETDSAIGPQTRELDVLTYNVAGLPEGLSSSMPLRTSPLISPLLNDYALVLLQEDFAYHPQIASAARHPYASPVDARGESLGDGLSFFSQLPFRDFVRERWLDCHGVLDSGSDCLTPKGFSALRLELAPDFTVDVYNLHADAGNTAGDVAARASNLRQLARVIATRSPDQAVIVGGDLNTRYARSEDGLLELLGAAGLTDSWVTLVRAGESPPAGEAVACSARDANDPACDRIDKLLYRSGESVLIEPLRYSVEGAKFVDEVGAQLSDHRPVSVRFLLTRMPDR